MNILISGAKGQLGMECVRLLETGHRLTCVDLGELDITVLDHVEKMVAAVQPEVILNCSAYTQVDRCETEKELAWAVNVTGPENLARCAARHDSRLIHISTDYVFDGMKPVPQVYLEDDATAPLSYYGVTKLEGENAVRRHARDYMILRTAWMYGWYGRNFLKTMLKLALKKPGMDLKVVDDQFGSPTWSLSLAGQIQKLIQENGQGVYHATSEGHCSWFDLAVHFLERMNVPHRIRPCTTADYPTPAVRPKNSILENGRLKQDGINLMRDWREDVDRFVDEFRDRLMQEAEAD